jgi:DNA repair protein RecN (Recombination protein N)
MRDRSAALVRLSRKYTEASPGQIDIAGVIAYADSARAELAVLDSGDDRLAELETEVERLRLQVAEHARTLHDERSAAGARLAAAVAGHLAELAMPGARLEVAVEEIEPAAHGADRVTFLLAANPGEPALSLAKAASGGERSRVALALRLALADADSTPVLVFDEVDAGIGGATANAVGRKLAKLAQGRQVLCVTHLPQLAAFADTHFIVTKQQAGDRTSASVEVLDERARVEELSRMLSGLPDSAVAADHAAELLATARGSR